MHPRARLGSGGSGTGVGRNSAKRGAAGKARFSERVAGAWNAFIERTGGGEGISPRRVVIVVVVLCFLALALATPIRTYFVQRGDLAEAAQQHARLVKQIDKLEEQKRNLEDPDYIRAQARGRLGFVEEGRTPYIVELPGAPLQDRQDGEPQPTQDTDAPWYSGVWDSISRDPAAEKPSGPVPNVIPPPNVTPAPADPDGAGS